MLFPISGIFFIIMMLYVRKGKRKFTPNYLQLELFLLAKMYVFKVGLLFSHYLHHMSPTTPVLSN